MNKSLIVKIVVLLLVLVGAHSVFWFFKTSAAKKHVISIVNSSDGNVSVSKVSVSGFPLSQKISIDDIKFQADAVADKIYLPNKYQVNIKHLEISGGVFSNDFKARINGQVSLQDANGNVGYVEFKQEPIINFSLVKNKIQKLSYQDSGYKIVDEAKNSLYEGGNSVVELTSSDAEGGKVINNVKASFNDLEGIDIFTTKKIMLLINPAAGDEGLKPGVSGAENIPVPAPALDPANPVLPEVAVDNSAMVPSGLAKKAIQLEIEYVMTPKSDEASKGAEAALELVSVNVKKLEFSSPLYKININGNFAAAPPSSTSAIADCNMIIQIEKIENILTYVKTALATSKPVIESSAALPAVTAVNPVNPAAASTSILPQNAITGEIAKAQQPEVDIAVSIMDLAKKNAGTKDNLAVFEIKKQKDGDFMVNETPLIELAKIFPAFAGDIVDENY